jgi:transposase
MDTELSTYYIPTRGGVHMTNTRRRYTKEFKLEAVQLFLSKGTNASEISRNLGIHPNLLNRWIREYNTDQEHSFPGLGKSKESDELRNLRKELADTKLERDILKKALAIFSKPSH